MNLKNPETTPQEREEALQSFFAASRQSRKLANSAKAKLEEVTPLLIDAIAHMGGDADPLLHKIISQSGTTCPETPPSPEPTRQ